MEGAWPPLRLLSNLTYPDLIHLISTLYTARNNEGLEALACTSGTLSHTLAQHHVTERPHAKDDGYGWYTSRRRKEIGQFEDMGYRLITCYSRLRKTRNVCLSYDGNYIKASPLCCLERRMMFSMLQTTCLDPACKAHRSPNRLRRRPSLAAHRSLRRS